MTLDNLIAELAALRSKIGGDSQVFVYDREEREFFSLEECYTPFDYHPFQGHIVLSHSESSCTKPKIKVDYEGVIYRNNNDILNVDGHEVYKVVLYTHLNPTVDFKNIVGKTIRLSSEGIYKVDFVAPAVGWAEGTAYELTCRLRERV